MGLVVRERCATWQCYGVDESVAARAAFALDGMGCITLYLQSTLSFVCHEARNK